MINLEATGNYISPKYITRYRLKTREKKYIYKLALINGKSIR
jgi:hypothetical protein